MTDSTFEADEPYTIISTHIVGEVSELITCLRDFVATDPRGKLAAEVTAVQINNRLIEISVRQFEDGTREIVLSASSRRSGSRLSTSN